MNELTTEISSPSEHSSIALPVPEHGNLTLTRVFSDLCDRLSKSIMQQKTIQERTLLDFSKISIIIVNHRLERLTDNFQKLSRLVNEYWHYGLRNETNQNRGYSYIRLYQMVSMIHTFNMDRELEFRAHAAVKENDANAELIMKIRKFPGITHRKLRAGLKETPESLKCKLHSLEENGYVIGQRSGEERYYVLTDAGDTLYRHLALKAQRQWVDQWSKERILVLYIVLEGLRERDEKPILVRDIEQIVASLNDKDINYILGLLINYKRKKDSSIDHIVFVKDANMFIEENLMEGYYRFSMFEKFSQR